MFRSEIADIRHRTDRGHRHVIVPREPAHGPRKLGVGKGRDFQTIQQAVKSAGVGDVIK